MRRALLKKVKRVVIKIGSRVLTDDEGALEDAGPARISVVTRQPQGAGADLRELTARAAQQAAERGVLVFQAAAQAGRAELNDARAGDGAYLVAAAGTHPAPIDQAIAIHHDAGWAGRPARA